MANLTSVQPILPCGAPCALLPYQHNLEAIVAIFLLWTREYQEMLL
jgi:hypothetical protein